ncbi:SGT1-domain-containing protein, partial [Aureobasidium melanogenum]
APGDGGPSALDFMLMGEDGTDEDLERVMAEDLWSEHGRSHWGVTVLQAIAKYDAGPVWAWEQFSVNIDDQTITKSSLYRGDVTRAALIACSTAIERIELAARQANGTKAGEADSWECINPDLEARPEYGTASASTGEPFLGGHTCRLPLLKAADRGFDVNRHGARMISRLIRASDSQPGCLTKNFTPNLYVYGGLIEDGEHMSSINVKPGTFIGIRNDAVCFKTLDGKGIWITHGRRVKKKTDPTLWPKVPAIQLFADVGLDPKDLPQLLPSLPTDFSRLNYPTFQEIFVEYDKTATGQRVAYLTFDFYNGAMSTNQCRQMCAALRSILNTHTESNPLSAVVLLGGAYFSNGIHLNVIESSPDPAHESWANINAIDDVVLLVLQDFAVRGITTVAALRGNAAAGGVALAAAADLVLAGEHVVVNPAYRALGLFGSEYHTVTYYGRVGPDTGRHLCRDMLPVSAQQAKDTGLVDVVLPGYGESLDSAIHAHVSELISTNQKPGQWKHKLDLSPPALAAARMQELGEMAKDFWSARSIRYHSRRSDFVRKVKATKTPLRFARHRRKVGELDEEESDSFDLIETFAMLHLDPPGFALYVRKMLDGQNRVQEVDTDDEEAQDFGGFGGGDGFSDFTKRLPDDCIEYTIFVIDSKLKTDYARREKLKAIQTAANSLLKTPDLKDYIWQREKFHLDLIDARIDSNLNGTGAGGASEEKLQIPGHDYYLHGRTNFGDSIADEWLIVWLLLELSQRHTSAWIQVRDPDGEFLLAEAANALPKWLEPELADNRVWIHRGQLHIIPLQRNAGNGASGPTTPGISGNVDIAQALLFLQQTPHSTMHSPMIEEEAFHRLREYPAAIAKSQHNALLSVPRRLAYLLHRNPAYVAPAIEAFYLRDPIAVKPLATKDTATLLFAPEDFVTMSVRFPKVGYAQLVSQDFPPPPAWVGITPHIHKKPVLLGMKLSCGFEMMLRDPQNKNKREIREMNMLLEDVDEEEDTLPSDQEIKSWPQNEDDDKWLDIDFNDFDKELKGRTEGAAAGDVPEGQGFGDESTQKDLQDMVSRFKKFLNEDEETGAETFSSGSSAFDSDDEDEDDEGEDKAASFTDAEFEQAMREMMGMPDTEKETNGLNSEARKLALEMEDEEEMERDDEKEAEQIWKMMQEIHEARKHGSNDKSKDKGKGKAFTPHAAPDTNAAGKNVRFEDKVREDIEGRNKNKGKGKAKARPVTIDDESSDDEDLLAGEDGDPQYEMLKNMLESFQGQGGMAGPAGNLMGLMGMGSKLPRN